ncbi:hypothetical protein D9V86_08535 [Bacteroidetes/Chlorobi group bacterium ChocPot_Mid]|nr:MAG: hypothetical protein D9V86_08535 [Bacteroidetes/Chlorobi group bacterium ChocPot_Mid]
MSKTFKFFVISAIAVLYVWSAVISYFIFIGNSDGISLLKKEYVVKVYFNPGDTEYWYNSITGGLTKPSKVMRMIEYVKDMKKKYLFTSDSTIIIKPFKSKRDAMSFKLEMSLYFSFKTQVIVDKGEE